VHCETWKDYSQVSKFDQNSDLALEYTGVEGTSAWWQPLGFVQDGNPGVNN